ncbi:MAG: helix-turn-helix domain-containing protein [Clostridia bacterium]|nr:helix-turn-helix domain-containing protein [Clostridia bacterium]
MKFQIFKTEAETSYYPLHEHKHYELILYVKGNGFLKTAQSDIPFEPGVIVIVPPGVKHGSCSENEFCNICIEGDWDSYFGFDDIVVGTDNERFEGTRLIELIYENRESEGIYLDLLCQTLVHFVMQRLKKESNTSRAVWRIADEITAHALDNQVDIAKILKNSGYAADYIRICFKKETGKTPTEYLTAIRMKHACYLLDIYKQKLSLAEIGEKCGYLDYVYFSKKFKEYVGVSPRTYQNV